MFEKDQISSNILVISAETEKRIFIGLKSASSAQSKKVSSVHNTVYYLLLPFSLEVHLTFIFHSVLLRQYLYLYIDIYPFLAFIIIFPSHFKYKENLILLFGYNITIIYSLLLYISFECLHDMYWVCFFLRTFSIIIIIINYKEFIYI